MKILKENKNKINWFYLSKNENIFNFEKDNNILILRKWIDITNLDWESLTINPNAIQLLKENEDKIDWFSLSGNQNATEILEKKDFHYIIDNELDFCWSELCLNLDAITLLEKNKDLDIIDWKTLSLNPNAIELLKENQDKIDWDELSLNPNIFTYNYKQMKKNMKNSGIAEELMAYIFHPKNMKKME